MKKGCPIFADWTTMSPSEYSPEFACKVGHF
jgi:hypothetical protein